MDKRVRQQSHVVGGPAVRLQVRSKSAAHFGVRLSNANPENANDTIRRGAPQTQDTHCRRAHAGPCQCARHRDPRGTQARDSPARRRQYTSGSMMPSSAETPISCATNWPSCGANIPAAAKPHNPAAPCTLIAPDGSSIDNAQLKQLHQQRSHDPGHHSREERRDRRHYSCTGARRHQPREPAICAQTCVRFSKANPCHRECGYQCTRGG